MPGKSYDNVLRFLAEMAKSEKQIHGELEELHAAMRRCREVFMAAVDVKNREIEHDQQNGDVEDKEKVVGVLKRLPRGGVIIDSSGREIFVPEVWVRNLSMEHGDMISAVPIGTLGKSMLYEFIVEERRGLGETSDRVGVVGPVVCHGGEWYIYSDEEGELISINPKEVQNLGLEEGDLVEVAYPAGDISAARVAWKYDPDDPFLDEVKKTKGQYKRQTRKRPVCDVADPLLEGKKVLVVGGDLYKDAYRQSLERRGAILLWESGFQGGQGKNIESRVRSADVVVLVTEMMLHRLPDVESMCKKYRKPYVYAPSRGATGVVRAAQQALLL